MADKPPKRDIEWFRAECNRVVSDDPAILSHPERKPFFDYWTEASASGVLRFQSEDFFDVRRRMRTWQSRASKHNGTTSNGNGQRPQMSIGEVRAELNKIRSANGIEPGGVLLDNLIPDWLHKAMKTAK